ncbi:MAG: pilus assembly protein TadG-related protein [Geminicoccaceae bacterium]
MRSQRQIFRGRLLSRLLRDQRGALITIVGLAIIPLFGAIGLSIDASRAYLAKSRLWSAVDAAALAGGRVYASDTRDDDVHMYFETNFPDGFMGAVLEPLEIIPDDVNRTITVTARATIPTTFMRVLGTDSVSIVASSEVTLEAMNIEVSLVLDITGSMAGSDIVDLRDAANQLVDMVVQDVQQPFYSKLSLVPYSTAVNVGGYATQVRGSYTSGICVEPDEPTCQYYRFENAQHDWTTHEISTCVTERAGPDAYTDAAPSVAPLGRNFPAPGTYNPCPENTIVPLTSNKALLHGEIDVLEAVGSTAGHIGVAWGWYMLSPNFGYLWDTEGQPAAYGAEDLIKVAIIMTDGEFNTVYYNGVIAEDSTSGSGSGAYKINEDSLNGSSNDQALELCNAMKAAGIVIYTVGYDIDEGTTTRERMEQCATEPEYAYFPEDGAELKQHFRAIAMKVSTLRLSK